MRRRRGEARNQENIIPTLPHGGSLPLRVWGAVGVGIKQFQIYNGTMNSQKYVNTVNRFFRQLPSIRSTRSQLFMRGHIFFT